MDKFKFRPQREKVTSLVIAYIILSFIILFAIFWGFTITSDTFEMIRGENLTFISFINMIIYGIGSFVFLSATYKLFEFFYPESEEEYQEAKEIARIRFERRKNIDKLREKCRSQIKQIRDNSLSEVKGGFKK